MQISALPLLLGIALGALAATVYWLARGRAAEATRARLEAELAASRQSVEDQRAALIDARDTFAALSKEALRENRTEFLENAGALLTPVRETLDKVQAQLGDTDLRRERSYGAVTRQLESLVQTQTDLRRETEQLSRALRSPNQRGRWGEVQLRKVVELAGMLQHCDFTEKATVTSEDRGRQTPDLVITLPGGASIVVDSKVPIDAYLRAVEAADDTVRAQHLDAHAKQVREHIKALGAKEYFRQFDAAPELVVMFMPLEPLMASAFERDATLLETAARHHIVLATPMTLLALLRTIAYGWQQQSLAENAEQIREIGRDLYERLAVLVQHLERVGANIRQAGDAYDQFVGSLEQKVLPAARRFKDLGVSSTKVVEAPDLLKLAPRQVTKSELDASNN
ncbi:MAG TPA: DNA recombination protein RmuC [Vicinamibacterales bacterium]|nr:DNA recombination protein RmuC [Vicinamibacterales bacterium]